ncbi:Formate/nitrite transporter FocA, FNT family [Candidatus Electrothrix marina]|uniref:Formate/nitrite transporter FocA, FNT family n=1 Tax=Candidatus Electrothrix marina TaxID=1859130 RepID=A0A444JEK7_9BACT|nr:Formate/nitrite transporter FocA, FNT family [Candidatus Electrothrix marina]
MDKLGSPLTLTAHTERSAERDQEDSDFIPVIIKRNDEGARHPDDILEKAITEGLEQIQRPFLSLALSSVAAALILSFSVMAAAVMSTLMIDLQQPLLARFAMALVYPLGFIICIMSGTELFTEHTATAVYPVLEGKADRLQLLRLWVIVFFGNMLGAVVGALLLAGTDQVVQAERGYVHIAHHLVEYGNLSLLFSAVLAGWLMALGGWLVLAATPALSQIICIYIVTFLIGVGGLHHSIAGSVEMFTALLISDHFSLLQGLRFIGLAMLGNLIGGSVFVATLNYGHIRKTQEI